MPAVFVVAFLLMHALPGDPLDRLTDPAMPHDQAERTRRALGLDLSLPVQFARTVASYLHGDLGVSTLHHLPVGRVLGRALVPSSILAFTAMSGAWVLALTALLLAGPAGPRLRGAADRLALLMASLPRFWLGVLAVLLFHDRLGWLPASHAGPSGSSGLLPAPGHLVLPAATLAVPAAATIFRYLLATAERAAASPAARHARALGVTGGRWVWQQVVRPSLSPGVVLLGLDLPALVSGALVVEIVFSWPGIGRTAAQAIEGGDYPLALAAALLSGVAVVTGGLLSDLAARRLDPRLEEAS